MCVNETMLFATLDDPDFCMECHTNSGSVQEPSVSGVPATIEILFQNKTYKHNVTGYSGLHEFSPNDEDRTYLSANKHVECNDCHNPHLAEAGLHSSNEVHVAAGTNEITDSGPLTGAFGVAPTWQPWNYGGGWDQGGASSWPTTSSTADKEYEICFKCHADYNTNFSSWGGAGTEAWTNLALEFNPYKQSYHPVVQALPEIDPGYEYDSYWDEEYDRYGSNQLPPAFTSVVIGDSGVKTDGSGSFVADSNKSWATNQWQDWGVRFGTRHNMYSEKIHDYVRTIGSNTSSQLTLAGYGNTDDLQDHFTVYSIEYYAGSGATKSGLTVTHSIKDFNLYLPSLVGYTVVIQNDPYNIFNNTVNKVAKGTVISNTATSFMVDGWTGLVGSVPADGTVAYYFSATGQTMMCSDCHSNDEISTTAAQGPHGSAVKWMLKGRNRAWPLASAASNGIGDDGTKPYAVHYLAGGAQARRYENDGTADGLFCLNCHSTVTFSKGGDGLQNASNVHSLHNSPCVNCHVLVPHGSKYSRLIGDQDDPMPDRYAFDNDLSKMGVTWYAMKAFDPDHSGRSAGPAAYPQGSHGSSLYCAISCHW
jgi:hypothetical protein